MYLEHYENIRFDDENDGEYIVISNRNKIWINEYASPDSLITFTANTKA